MCQTAPCRVLDVTPDGRALVSDCGRPRTVLTLYAGEPVAVGDWVLVHAGLVVRRLDEADAAAVASAWAELEVGG